MTRLLARQVVFAVLLALLLVTVCAKESSEMSKTVHQVSASILKAKNEIVLFFQGGVDCICKQTHLLINHVQTSYNDLTSRLVFAMEKFINKDHWWHPLAGILIASLTCFIGIQMNKEWNTNPKKSKSAPVPVTPVGDSDEERTVTRSRSNSQTLASPKKSSGASKSSSTKKTSSTKKKASTKKASSSKASAKKSTISSKKKSSAEKKHTTKELENMTVTKGLNPLCKKYGLSVGGVKGDKVKRILDFEKNN